METITLTQFKLSDLKNLRKVCTRLEFRNLLCSDEINTPEKLRKAYYSIKDGYITPDEIMEGDFFEDVNGYYSSETYVETREGEILHGNDAYFCDYFQEYSSEIFRVRNGRDNLMYCRDAINDANLYRFDGEYYTEEGLQYNNLVVVDGDVYHLEDVYFNEETGEYQTEPINEYTRGYHDCTDVIFVDFSKNPTFRIGYEIEKEDKDVKQSIFIDDFENSCNHWRKEKDGSLCEFSGFEIISPAYELSPEKIANEIENNPVLLKHINAKVNSKRCGGHINISQNGLTGSELFERIKGYTPLFYALYYKRVDKYYSKGKSNKDLQDDNQKYQAIRIHSTHLEYRIISGVIDFTNLMWRTELFNLILNNPTNCPKQAYFNFHSVLKTHIEKVYTNCLKFEKLNNRLIEYTQQFEGIQLTNNQ